MLWTEKSIVSARNQTAIPWLFSLQPSYYTNYTTLACLVEVLLEWVHFSHFCVHMNTQLVTQLSMQFLFVTEHMSTKQHKKCSKYFYVFCIEACGMVRPQYMPLRRDDPVPPSLPTSCYPHPQNMLHVLSHILRAQQQPFQTSPVAVSTGCVLDYSSEMMCWCIFHVLTVLKYFIQGCCHRSFRDTVSTHQLDTNHTPLHSTTFSATSFYAIPHPHY
jgi:hypothetical protein